MHSWYICSIACSFLDKPFFILFSSHVMLTHENTAVHSHFPLSVVRNFSSKWRMKIEIDFWSFIYEQYLYWFARAARTQTHRRGDCNSSHLCSHSIGGRRSKNTESEVSASPLSLSPLFADGCLLAVSSHGFSLCFSLCLSVSPSPLIVASIRLD
jgi:hypothetical protein